MQWNNKFIPSLNVINRETATYRSKGVIRHYHYRSDTNLVQGIVSVRIITCSFHYFTTQLCLPWYSKIKGERNQLDIVEFIVASTP